ncbi:MAG TPA: ATP-dependent zinc metalloprotease FtsH [Kiritimatiellia bacterium]
MAIWLLLLALFLTMLQIFSQGQERYIKIPYSPDFVQLVELGKIRKCEIILEVSGVRYVKGELVDVDEKTGHHRKFRVNVAETEELQKLLSAKGVQFEVSPQNPYVWQALSAAIPVMLILGLLYFLFVRQMRLAGKGAMSFGKSRAKLLTRGKNRITFEDVAGVDEAREEVQEIVEFLKDPKRFQKLGGRIPKGVLLVGPPGSGKTLLAKAIAGEANVPFFSISGSDFVEMFVGVGASRVRDMFEQGKKNAPCIIFIDEIDAVGRSRFSGIGGGHDEREQTLNALLVEMDGFDTQEGIIIIAATNRPDVLDTALLRPGRFDRQIVVDLPSLDGREGILKIHARRIKLSREADLKIIARGTPGFSGADLANLVNEAALLAARRNADAVELHDLEEARDKVRWGRERRSRLMDDKEKRLTAYHEAGHAIVLALVEEAEPLHKVTIIPRGQALGATMQLPEKDSYTQGRRKLTSILVGLMGGRAAEEIACTDITTGAQSDLKQATRIARLMVCDWGMSPEMGPQSYGDREELLFLGREVSRNQDYSEATAQKIDGEVNRLLREAHQRAMDILNANRDKLDTVALMLLERETLDGREVVEIVKHGRILSTDERDKANPPSKPTAEASPAPVDAPAAKASPSVIGPASPKPSPA